MATVNPTPYTDYVLSAALGVVLSVVLIHVASGPQKKFKIDEYSKDDDTEQRNVALRLKKQVLLDENKVLENSEFVRDVLGITSEQLKEAVHMTNEELKQDQDKTEVTTGIMDSTSSWTWIMDALVTVAVLALCFQSFDIMLKGDLGRMVIGMFPREAESIALAKTRLLELYNQIIAKINSFIA